jgi:hypothetical protein
LNYDENEEATKIKQLTLLTFSRLKTYLITPLLILSSGFLFGIAIYWKPSLQAFFFYSKVKTLSKATHILIEGSQENLEICELKKTS